MSSASKSEVTLIIHGIGIPHAGVEHDELPFWITEEFFTQIIELIRSLQKEHNISITFDDGNLSDVEIGLPILTRHQLLASFFILTGRLNRPHYLSGSHLEELRRAGMEIGLHGKNHVDWRQLNMSELNIETFLARSTLESIGNCTISTVGIPFGAYNRKVIESLSRQGFTTIFTSDGGRNSLDACIKSRTSIRSDMTLTDVSNIIVGNESVKRRIRRYISCFLRRHVF